MKAKLMTDSVRVFGKGLFCESFTSLTEKESDK